VARLSLDELSGDEARGLAPAGPELRRRPALAAFDGRPGVVISAPLAVEFFQPPLSDVRIAGVPEAYIGLAERLAD
jgi:hypothetical protein